MLGLHIGLGLQVGPQLTTQGVVVRQADEHATLSSLVCRMQRSSIAEVGVAVAQRAHEGDLEAALELVSDRVIVTEPGEAEVATGHAVGVLANIAQDVFEEQACRARAPRRRREP